MRWLIPARAGSTRSRSCATVYKGADPLTALKEAGLDTPSPAPPPILDDEVRWVLTKGKLPTSAWIE
ncbi:hypothetical protein GCM10011610_26610 [Nocardia rhizosphaerihabitans]|uniref:Uncharacterized protein n=1 Tax=Nocardia rhizosphaerihabitans TaxID=1691570 RepID=A0ABQ2KBR6_9NOCA|nr:hypothetical protein GCM10011610_26610 [Nocardia rhizosphaerihabitans]